MGQKTIGLRPDQYELLRAAQDAHKERTGVEPNLNDLVEKLARDYTKQVSA